MPNVKILFFARARELVGNNESQLELPQGATVSMLAETLEHQVCKTAALV